MGYGGTLKDAILWGCDVLRKGTRRDVAMQKAVRHWISDRTEQVEGFDSIDGERLQMGTLVPRRR